MGRRGYPAEFRRKVLDLLADGKSVASIAHDLECLVPGLMETIKPGGSSNGCTTEVPRRTA